MHTFHFADQAIESQRKLSDKVENGNIWWPSGLPTIYFGLLPNFFIFLYATIPQTHKKPQ